MTYTYHPRTNGLRMQPACNWLAKHKRAACAVCACHQRRRPQTGSSQHRTEVRRKNRTHVVCACHQRKRDSELPSQTTPQTRPLPKPDPCRFHPTNVTRRYFSRARCTPHVHIGHGTKRRIRRCIPCMFICICMWMWMWMWMCAQRTRAVRARIT